MMFNGLLMCGDSDNSDFTKESFGASSSADTCSSAWDADARADYYHSKLTSTLQVLQNKEETLRVQGESLRVAEARIAQLTARAQLLRDQLDAQTLELRAAKAAAAANARRADVSADAQEVKKQKALVRSLQTNLSVIEDLYRECFYETAKQEELVEGLRQSYLETRADQKQKSEDIGLLRQVIYDQHWSLERCQGIASDVDNLKLEISNFLNSSNNDSGMWERGEDSLPSEVLDDLHHISDQLLQLRTMLTSNCTCGLEEENIRLKTANEAVTIQVASLQRRVEELEAVMAEKEDDKRYTEELEVKSKELESVRQQMALLEEEIIKKDTACEASTEQLQRTHELIEDQSRQLSEALQHCAAHENTIRDLQHELNSCNDVIEQKSRVAAEALDQSQQLANELDRVTKQAQRLDENYRAQAACACSLQLQLEQAHARGAELCASVRGALLDVRARLRHLRRGHRYQEDKIKQQELIISSLRHRLETSQSDAGKVRIEDDTCCTKCISLRSLRCRKLDNETAGCSKCARVDERWEDCLGTSGSEVPSASSAPTPPRRLLRKKPPPCNTSGWCGRTREVGVQQPHRRDASSATGSVHQHCLHLDRLPREVSQTSELEQRLDTLHAVLEMSSRRWAHAHTR